MSTIRGKPTMKKTDSKLTMKETIDAVCGLCNNIFSFDVSVLEDKRKYCACTDCKKILVTIERVTNSDNLRQKIYFASIFCDGFTVNFLPDTLESKWSKKKK